MQTKILAVLSLAAALHAQTVHFRNDSPVPYEGWARASVDRIPPHRNGIVTTANGDTFPYLLGRQVGLDTRMLDVRVHLEPGQVLSLTLDKSTAFDIERAPQPENLTKHWGGLCSIAGIRLTRQSLDFDGAGYLLHFSGRLTPMLFANVWIHWCADQPWARGEVLLTASNCTIPDMGAEVLDDMRLKVGDAIVVVPGRGIESPLIDPGTAFGDGQARAIPFTLVWPRHVKRPDQWASFGCVANLSLCSVGIAKLLPEGNPRYPSGFDARAWSVPRLAESIRRIHTWEVGVVGPNKRSGDTGAQQDQTFVCGESLLALGVGAERIAMLGGYRMASRPLHHLELDGSQVRGANHPQLVYWDARPHWHTGVSPDRLGKTGGGSLDAHGWAGPDVEHAFNHCTIAGARLTGSPLLQHLLSALARVYPLQWTWRPELIYQSVPFAPRAVGWEADLVLGLWFNLEDRALAEATKAHYLERCTRVLVPQLRDLPGDVWGWTRDDRLGPGIRYMPWQQGIAAYFLVRAGEEFRHDGAKDLGVRAARAVIRDAWWLEGDHWTCRNVVAQDGAAVPSGSFDYFGSSLAIAALMRVDPTTIVLLIDGTTKASVRAIWTDLLGRASSPADFAWLAPGLK